MPTAASIPFKHNEECALYRKINRHLLPLPMWVYFFCVMDIINISLAKFQIQQDIALSDAAYGLGAGIVFIGYMLFDIPSTLLLSKIGARKTFSRIMALAGLISIALLFIRGAHSFVLLRFLLGVFEAGAISGAMFYFTLWYPESRMARTLALFTCAPTITNMIFCPVSAWLMTHLTDMGGLKGWQWLFLLQGLFGIILSIILFLKLDDTPMQAKWLSEQEKENLKSHCAQHRHLVHTSFLQALKKPRIYAMAFSYFCIMCGAYLVIFWLPTLLKMAGVTDLMQIGLLLSIPSVAVLIVKIMLGTSADRIGERRWHSALAVFAGALTLSLVTPTASHPMWLLFNMSCAWAFLSAAASVFITLCSDYLKANAAAGGIAFIGSVGMLGSFFGSAVMGWSKVATGSFQAALFITAGVLIVGGVTTIACNQLPFSKHHTKSVLT